MIRNHKINIFITIIALAMILSSGVMNYYWVIPLDKQIAKDRQEISAKQALIKDVWENITYKESKADVAILILALAKEDKDNAQKIVRIIYLY